MNVSKSDLCPLCKQDAEYRPLEQSFGRRVSCDRCGTYLIEDEAIFELEDHSDAYILSGITRRQSDEGKPATISSRNIVDLVASVVPPAGPQELLERTLMYIASQVGGKFFDALNLDPAKDYPVVFATGKRDFVYMLMEAEGLGLLRQASNQVRLTAEGWHRVQELRSARIDSDQAFVAMWFDESVNAAWTEGIQPALEQVGYRPLRIDEKQFNDKIDDQIIAEIRRSGLVVADVTGHRGRVYFEAGFAMGLGLPVIWTCSKDEIEKAHFDTRQYNHIVWQDPEDLKTRLIARVEATGLARVPDGV